MSVSLLHRPEMGAAGAAIPAAQAFVDWLCETALPFWASRRGPGVLPFAEQLDLDGEPNDLGHVRLRVAARQVAVYSQAAAAGIGWAEPIAERYWEFFARHYWSTISGWYAKVGGHGQAVDTDFALYDQAFAIYACGCRISVDTTSTPLAMTRRTLVLIDRRLKSAGVPGWSASFGKAGRCQNSHMHYLEALLALHEQAPSPFCAERIEHLCLVAAKHLFDRRHGVIVEQFDDNWTRVRMAVEPGHLYEWVWLLERARAMGFACGVPTDALVDFANRYGWSATGLIRDSCLPDGTVLADRHRLWPHCEALRAATALAGEPTGRALAHIAASTILDRFIAPSRFAGGWIERLDSAGKPTLAHVPASSLYHLWEAAAALVRTGWAAWSGGRQCS